MTVDADMDALKAELLEFIRDENRQAKREVAVIGTVDYPSKWDVRHKHLDELLNDYFDCD